MSGAQHTPGPFETDGLTVKAPAAFGSSVLVTVATMAHFVPAPERQATAALFAAAPELYSEAQWLLQSLINDGHADHYRRQIEGLSAAISKATGSAS